MNGKAPADFLRTHQTCPGENREPESSLLKEFQIIWAPVTLSRLKPGTGVTTSSEIVNFTITTHIAGC
jgi:hypothetical protein